jgi:hypothetical protein
MKFEQNTVTISEWSKFEQPDLNVELQRKRLERKLKDAERAEGTSKWADKMAEVYIAAAIMAGRFVQTTGKVTLWWMEEYPEYQKIREIVDEKMRTEYA